MKKFWLVCLMLCVVTLSSCKSETTLSDNKVYPCIGLGDTPNPKLVYKASVRNIVVGVIFFELVVPPVTVVVNEFYCPVGIR